MADTPHDLMHQAIQRTLTPVQGGGWTVGALSDTVVDLWHQIAGRLEPVVGKRGFNVLFERSLQLASKTFLWLALIEANEAMGVSLTSLQDVLKAQDAGVAREASCAVLVSFTNLLTSLIGASLADRLLQSVWTPLPHRAEQETQP